MAFSGIDDIVAEIGAAKFVKQPWSRTIDTGATSAAGRWHSCLTNGGTGGPMTLTGPAGVGIIMNSATPGALPLNAAVTPDIRALLAMLGISNSPTSVPATLILTDIIHIYPSVVLTGAPTALSNHPTWTGAGDTRMTNANGVQASLLVTTATTAGNGRITPSYLDQGGAGPVAGGSLFAAATAHPTGCFYGATNTIVTPGGLNMPLAAGDIGVQRISSYAIDTGATSGVGCFMLHRPIASVPLVAANVAGERSFLQDVLTLPRIYDDACLGFFINIGGALVAGGVVQGELNYAWG